MIMIMAEFDEPIFDEDDEFGDYSEPQNTGDTQEPNGDGNTSPSNDTEDDLTSEVLRLKGIADPNKIKFEDETGAIIERSWDNLTRAEQLNILASQEE
jgi:hypothetical protein